MKRFLGFVIAVMAIIGGMNAIGNTLNSEDTSNDQLVFEAEKSYAAAFIQSFLTIGDRGPIPISTFTSVNDQRKGGKEKQEVLGVWPLSSYYDENSGFVQVELIVTTETIIPRVNQTDLKEVRNWKAHVQVESDENSNLGIPTYPTLFPYETSSSSNISLSSDNESADAMKPMLSSFFKTYMIADRQEDVANFLTEGIKITPMHGALEFFDVQKVRAIGEGNEWLVFVDLKVADPLSGLQFFTTYQLEVVKDQEKYYIKNLVQI